MTWESFTFRLETDLVRSFYRYTKLRPSSQPFITGDGFRKLAQWEFDFARPELFVPKKVKPYDLVYCRGDWLRDFLTGLAKEIPVPFSILSHNDDTTLTDEWTPFLPPRLVRLFAQNAEWSHERVVPLPIGLENAFQHYNGVISDFVKLRRKPLPERNRILYAFTEGTNAAVRKPANKALSTHPLAVSLTRVNSRSYRKIAREYRFVASPPGNGIDCHRTWEALYLGIVPIVIRSKLTEHFCSLGLPLWLVDSYDELSRETESDLDRRYHGWVAGFDSPILWMDYWTEILNSAKTRLS